MAALSDTSILIDQLRRIQGATDLLSRAFDAEEPVFASVLTKVEILAGMRKGEELRIRRLFDLLIWIPVSDSLAERAGRFASRYRPSHPRIDPVDLMIAATREELDVPLWTLNVRHFPMIRGLRAPY